MTEGERIKAIRIALDLTLEKFAGKIGVTKGAMSNIEKSKRNATEQMKRSVCREFNANYIYLTTGDGDMFINNDDAFIAAVDAIMMGESSSRKNLFKALVNAPDEDIEAIERFILSCAKNCTTE